MLRVLGSVRYPSDVGLIMGLQGPPTDFEKLVHPGVHRFLNPKTSLCNASTMLLMIYLYRDNVTKTQRSMLPEVFREVGFEVGLCKSLLT